MPVERATESELAEFRALIAAWAERERSTNPLVLAVDQDRELDRWYIRMQGEEKSFITLWLTLRQRTLHYETYFMPSPIEQREQCYEFLLRANVNLFGMRFALGAEDALYLVGQMPLSAIDEAELDRITGAAYAYTEHYFPTAMGIGYGPAFRHPSAGRLSEER